MPENKTKEEIQQWLADKKRKKGDKLVIVDKPAGSSPVAVKVEVEVL